jgi:hypothetical protein
MILNTKIKDLKDNQQAIYTMLDELAIEAEFESLDNYLNKTKGWNETVYTILQLLINR